MRLKKWTKRLVIFLIVFNLGVMLGLYGVSLPSYVNRGLTKLYRCFGYKTYFTWLVLRNKLYNPKDISNWLIKNIEYVSDNETWNKSEYWQTPLETISKRTGDCEDFAFVAQELLNQIGIESCVIGMYYVFIEGGHAVCIFKWEGRYYILDNGSLIKGTSTDENIRDLLQYHYDIIYYFEVLS
jgi:predicted transglutaminase-like cysteine proteinase